MSISVKPNRKPTGVSLLEILIVLPIIVIAGFVTVQIMFQAYQAYKYSLAEAEVSTTFVRTLDRIGRVVRSSNKVISATNNDLTVESYFSPRDNAPDKARYYYAAGVVKVDVTPATGTPPNYIYSSADTKTYTIVNALNAGSQPLFNYYDENGTALSSPYDLNSIRKIGINLVINPQPKVLKQNQSSSTQVQLRNLKTNL